MSMKISWVIIVAVLAFVLFRKQIAGAIDSLSTAAADKIKSPDSASKRSPLDNLLKDQTQGAHAKNLVSEMVDKLQSARQDYLAEDLFEDPDNINVSGVTQADFITTLRSQEDKILAVPNPAAFQAKGINPNTPKRKQEQSWWPNKMYDLNPAWN